MDTLATALVRLGTIPAVQFDGRLAQRLTGEAELAVFDRTIAKMRSARPIGEGTMPKRADIDALAARWVAGETDLATYTKREIRALCWDQRAAGSASFIGQVSDSPQLAPNARLLRGLWYSYERNWRLATSPAIERLLRARAEASSTVPRWLGRLRDIPRIFSATAPTALAHKASSNWRAAGDCFEYASVTADGSLFATTFPRIVDAWLKEVGTSKRHVEHSEVLAHGLHGLASDSRLPGDLFVAIVEALIGALDRADPAYKAAISTWILNEKRLGHPARVATRINWNGISARARQLAVQLFALRDLGAFFEVLIGNAMDEQRRRPFWEKYAGSAQLVNFAIASDPADRRRLTAKVGNDRADVATLADAPDSHSCFLMHFRGRRDIVVAEMSKANNAMYVFDAKVFEKNVGSLEHNHHHFYQLKDATLMLSRHSHVQGWHPRFRAILGNYGIFPGIAT